MERIAEETDILIIGGGPAGMSAAIRARQIAEEKGAVCFYTIIPPMDSFLLILFVDLDLAPVCGLRSHLKNCYQVIEE